MKIELIVSDLIRQDRCPYCGAEMKDKGSYVRCTSCSFELTRGTWATSRGYALRMDDVEWLEGEELLCEALMDCCPRTLQEMLVARESNVCRPGRWARLLGLWRRLRARLAALAAPMATRPARATQTATAVDLPGDLFAGPAAGGGEWGSKFQRGRKSRERVPSS